MGVDSSVFPFFYFWKDIRRVMTRLDKFKEYMDTCEIYSCSELKRLSDYPFSVQFLRGLLRGDFHFTEKQEKICYEAVNMARAVKQGKIKHEE